MDSLSTSRTGTLRHCIAGLMALAAVTLGVASTIHFGVRLGMIHDPFAGAAIPEAVIAFVVACGCVAVIVRRAAWPVSLGTTLFALVGVLYGLSVTLRGDRTGDIAYHLSLLVVLVVTLCLLVTPAARGALRRG
jgi:hypothetical protein